MFLIDSTRDVTRASLQLIAEKIEQPEELPRITRPRLLEMIERSVAAGTSTIISGRAGTGKTTLALDFANRCGRAVVWYKVDAPDADPKIFFRYLITAIRQQRPGFGTKSLMPLVEVADLDHIAWLTEAFVYELVETGNSTPMLIVIEDLHQVSDADWLVPFFQRLLPLLPSEVHMLITSRSLPPAPLWRMRSKQSLVVIDEEALAFTRPEAIALFDSYGLPSDQTAIALDHTNGRAIALDEFAVFQQRKIGAQTSVSDSGAGLTL
ncbi:MAG TPA: AAA family ATPase [Pyrinomonadaceae bacterium]|nr:AAA family ATPase [Pyrinomonadaceae bacterium]